MLAESSNKADTKSLNAAKHSKPFYTENRSIFRMKLLNSEQGLHRLSLEAPRIQELYDLSDEMLGIVYITLESIRQLVENEVSILFYSQNRNTFILEINEDDNDAKTLRVLMADLKKTDSLARMLYDDIISEEGDHAFFMIFHTGRISDQLNLKRMHHLDEYLQRIENYC